MLYDPKWEVKTKPAVFSLESLIAWLEIMPADRPYNYFDTDACMAAQYCASQGREYMPPNPFLFWKYWSQDFRYNMESIAVGQPRTFGAALDRARKALAA